MFVRHSSKHTYRNKDYRTNFVTITDLLEYAVCFIFKYRLAFIIAGSFLLAGSVRNAYHIKYRTLLRSENVPSCETLRKGVFGAGAAFIVFTGITSELYYVSFSKANNGPPPYVRDTGVRMGNL